MTKHELGQSTKTSKAPCHRQPSLTQLNKHCLFANKFSRSVEFAASQSYLLNSITTRLNARPVYTRQSLKQTMLYKPKLCKHLHQLQRRTSNANTCYAKHLLLMQITTANSRQRTAPIRYAHQNVRTHPRNLSKFRPKFQPKFPTQTHVDFSIEPQHIQNLTNRHTHTKCYAIC